MEIMSDLSPSSPLRPELPKVLQDKVATFPEYKYGVNRVIVVLEDGTQIHDVLVAWAKEIVKVGVSEDILFDPSRIVDVQNQ